MTPINGAFPLAQPSPIVDGAARPAPVSEGSGELFASMLESAVAGANTQTHAAADAAQAFAAGAKDDIHGTMLALSKADIELRVVGNVRNKVIDAFYELWRMQI